jgi:hypothetical protein
MAALSKLKHKVIQTPNLGLTSTYATTRAVQIPLYQDAARIAGNDVKWNGVIESVVINYTTATGIASILSFLSRDAAGNAGLTPSLTTNVTTGTTTATSGCIRVNYDLTLSLNQTSLWLFLRTNAATCVVTSVELTWRE